MKCLDQGHKQEVEVGALTATDRLDVMDLLARYAWAYDCGDPEAYADVFADDGLLEDTGELHAQGRAAIIESIKVILEVRGADVWQHFHDQLIIRGDSEACTVHCYWLVVATKAGEVHPSPLASGYVINECAKIDNAWRLRRRAFGYGVPADVPGAARQLPA